MGDRSVVGFRDNAESPTLYLYSHWSGTGMFAALGDALTYASARWKDPAYATRICVSQIIGDAWNKETGFGLSVGHYTWPDVETIPVVSWNEGRVDIYRHQWDGGEPVLDQSLTFQAFRAIVRRIAA